MVLGIVIGALSSQVLGFLWYSPYLFGKAWLRAVHPGKTEEQVGKENQWSIPISMLSNSCLVMILHYFIGGYLGVTTVEKAVMASILLSLVLTIIDIPHLLFSHRSPVGFLIDHGYDTMVLMTMMCSLCYFG